LRLSLLLGLLSLLFRCLFLSLPLLNRLSSLRLFLLFGLLSLLLHSLLLSPSLFGLLLFLCYGLLRRLLLLLILELTQLSLRCFFLLRWFEPECSRWGFRDPDLLSG